MTSAIDTHTLIIVFQMWNFLNKTFVDVESDMGFITMKFSYPLGFWDNQRKVKIICLDFPRRMSNSVRWLKSSTESQHGHVPKCNFSSCLLGHRQHQSGRVWSKWRERNKWNNIIQTHLSMFLLQERLFSECPPDIGKRVVKLDGA